MPVTHYLARPLPEALQGLATLALDLRWSWHHAGDALWRAVDPDLWASMRNPWLILETVSERRLEELSRDSAFLEVLHRQLAAREEHLHAETWFNGIRREGFDGAVAYFSMEFGLSESLRIYSGGLGVLAGDHLKTACDLGVPLFGIGLLYQQGYFRQALDPQGEQLEFFPYNDPTMMPVVPLRDAEGEWVRVLVELPGRTLRLRAWQVKVGRRWLYLLDSNDPLNAPGDRGITSALYGGGSELRLQQEIVLGIGGWRLVDTLGLDCPVCHLNEGHAAFAILERTRTFMTRNEGISFEAALSCTRGGNLFTTHTPVAAGFDRFNPGLFTRYFNDYVDSLGVGIDTLLALGRLDSGDRKEAFNMAYLAVRGSAAVNGVSRLHGAVSRHIFQPLFPNWPEVEVPVGHVTNGVHVPSWDSAAADELWTGACGKSRWLGVLETLEADLRAVSDESLWAFRGAARRRLVDRLRVRMAAQRGVQGSGSEAVRACASLLDPDSLTLGFARRFAAYKRPNLLLKEPERLVRLLARRERPVQLVIAGKAHPQDAEGKAMIREWAAFVRRPDVQGRVIFLADYDLALAEELVQGVDLWINTPRRPWEASGTSGMKVLVNGGLNLSELDGWWAEAYAPDVGWALGDRREHGADPAWDWQECQALYRLLEGEVVPTFYERDAHGVPRGWVARVRESMARLTPQFSTNRMLREYTEAYYLPLTMNCRKRAADGGALGKALAQWREMLARHWPVLRFGNVAVEEGDGVHRFAVQVYLDELDPGAVHVELYADGDPPVREVMGRGEVLAGGANAYVYTGEVPSDRAPSDYTPRIVPYHPDAIVPLEAQPILWAH